MQAAAQMPAWAHRSAETLLPAPGLIDEGVAAGQHGAERRGNPFVKSIQTESHFAANALAGVPAATAAFIRRAPSMWVLQPCSCARSRTSSSCWRGQIVPPPRLAVCSTESKRCSGA